MADVAGHVDVGQEVHLNLHKAVAAAGLAAAALDVEGEAARPVAPGLGLRRGGEKVADVVEEARIGGGVGARRLADGALVDADDLVEVLDTLEAVAAAGPHPGTVQLSGQRLVDDLVDEAGLAGAGHAGDAGKGAEGDVHIDAPEVVLPAAEDLEAVAVAGPPHGGDRNFLRAGEVLARQGLGAGHDVLQRTLGHHVTAQDAGPGADVNDLVCGAHGVLVVLDNDERVAEVPEVLEGIQELVVVPLVQADGRLVEDIEHAHEAGADLGGQADALALAAGEGGRGPGQRQIAEAHVLEEAQPGADFLEDALGDDGLCALQRQVVHELQGFGDGQAAEIGDGHPAHGDGPGDV